MLKSKIGFEYDNPRLFIENVKVPAMAYTTYLPELSCHGDFIKAGYNIFFVNVSFTTLPINSITGISPFRVGVFENKDNPDYSEFENAVYDILKEGADAVIFPRINISMPKWWIEAHPDHVVATRNAGFREILFSDVFRSDAAVLLRELIKHIKEADYSKNVGGWQICGGLTQEWFHHDYFGSLCEGAAEPYRKWVKENYNTDNAELPKKEDYEYSNKAQNENENAVRYSMFCNVAVAETIDYFASVIKKETNNSQIVGTFYGYAYQSNGRALFGTHGLRRILKSNNLDFFSSPNAYSNNREFGIDWADMMPVDSVKLNKKLCFIECDIRTHLTKSIQEARPNEYPDDVYRTKDGKSVWCGPPTEELSVMALKKCFAHQISKASAIWWFDMWGGWYRSEKMMSELAFMKKEYERELSAHISPLKPQVVFFADESAHANCFNNSPQLIRAEQTRTAMGNTGVPFDCYMVEDAKDIIKNYKAAVFVMPIPSKAGEEAIKLCERLNIPYISATADKCSLTVDELKEFYKNNNIHFFTSENDVVYLGNGYVGLHSKIAGKKELKLPKECFVSPVFGAEITPKKADVIEFDLEENSTVLFRLT